MALCLWRYFLFAGLLLYWPLFIQRYAKRHGQPDIWIKAMLQWRIVVVLMFASIELLVTHNGIGYLLEKLVN